MSLKRRLGVASARLAEGVQLVREGGPNAVAMRVLRRTYLRSGAATLTLGLESGEVADSTTISWRTPTTRPSRGTPIHAVWLSTPPGAGSGGHTTMLRVMQGLIEAGHHCTLLIYDRFRGRHDRHVAIVREGWPWYTGALADFRDGMPPADVYFATSWETAHVLGARGSVPGRRMYFVQDYEPYFYGRGSEYALCEDTYRFGFSCIAIGHMVAEALREFHDVESTVAEYGCDTSVYTMRNKGSRSGVIFYAKPDVLRRGYALGLLALEEFHRRHPDQRIHLFGDPVGKLPFPTTHHGRVSPSELAALYGSCSAGLVLSFTNISLVPLEMMACGALPVVNDSRLARFDLVNEHGGWAQPTPVALAAALSDVVTDPNRAARAATAAASVVGGSWDHAKRAVVAAVEGEVFG